jgi:hypothetical protein
VRKKQKKIDIGLERMTVAYSRASNLGNVARRNRLGPTFNTFLSPS